MLTEQVGPMDQNILLGQLGHGLDPGFGKAFPTVCPECEYGGVLII
jgi:hypothetical protein